MPLTPGYRDVTDEVRAACSQLNEGQMVSVPGFTLMDAMSAIQIMDARMDSGMALPLSELPASERVVGSVEPFSPKTAYTDTEVLWILDRLLACEAAWHRGAALSQTLYTCLHFHHAASGPGSGGSGPTVLRAFLRATVKSISIAWAELAKQNVYDGEDYYGDKAGLRLLEDTSVSRVLAELEAALALSSVPEGVRARLAFRKHLLTAQDTAAAGAGAGAGAAAGLETRLAVKFALGHLDAVVLCDPARTAAPSARAAAAFDPAYNRQLVSSAPLRPIALPAPEATRALYTSLLHGLAESVALLDDPSFTKWKTFLTARAVAFHTDPRPAYVRSLFQSAICDRNLIARRLALEWIAESFLAETAGFSPARVRQLARAPQPQPNAFALFLQRLASHLVQYLCTFTHNRARQKRAFAKSYTVWVSLCDQAPDEMRPALQSLALDVSAHIIFSGFELDLYRRDEWGAMYWLAAHVCQEQAELSLSLAAGPAALLHTALARLCQARIGSGSESGSGSGKRGAREVFLRRTKWVPHAEQLWGEVERMTPPALEERQALEQQAGALLSQYVEHAPTHLADFVKALQDGTHPWFPAS